jgi:DNA repair exonuclease SbcCD nuclease subunit
MNSFVYCSDSHIANRPPEKRIDDYNKAIRAKWQWIINYAIRKKADGIICGGDLCHTHKTSDELLYRWVEMMRKSGLPFYYLYGNHDIQAGNVSYIEKTNMGLLSQHDWFHELDAEKLIEFSDCYLTGINYSHDKECAETFDWQEGNLLPDVKRDKSKCMVLVTHAMITNKQILVGTKIRATDVKDIVTNADILLNGHFHDGHPEVVHSGALEHTYKICNPGSIARMNLKEARDGHGPRIAYITINRRGSKIKLVDIPCAPIKKIFDTKKSKTEKREKRDKDKFIDTLSKMSGQTIMGDNFEQALKETLENPPKKLRKRINKRTRQILLEKLEECRGK